MVGTAGSIRTDAVKEHGTMDGGINLVIMCIVMLTGSYFSGSIPLFMPMSEEKLQVDTITSQYNLYSRIKWRGGN